jgi:UDP-N-acetylmuramoyl-L-alanyl-D-glutamate--2,6-diaminopimelate ligase
MKLKQLIKSLGNCDIYSNLEDFDVEGISCNSKDIKENFIFVAIKGTCVDGHKFIKEAEDRGAKAIVVQSQGTYNQLPQKAIFIKVKDSRKALAKLASDFYGNPSSKIKIIGITGTNGKTTVSYLLEALLKEAGFNPAVIGTVNYRFRDKILPSKNTTPNPIELQSMLADMLRDGIDYAAMEVSSHALDQDRVGNIDFHSAIFTNLSQDHLDYHNTMDNYFQAKAKLFKNIYSPSFVVLNNDDEYGRRIKRLTRVDCVTYGIENHSDISAKDIKFDILHTEFCLVTSKMNINLRIRLIGRYNVYNALAVIAWGFREGIDIEVIKSALQRFNLVPGRLEKIDFDGDFSIFVDYAHTEDALRNVIGTLRQITNNRIIVVFGCGGQRDKTKRPKMGFVVSELADYAIITNDNPRSEDPQEIIEDIKKGIENDNYCVIPDRREAIKKSLSLAKSGDLILVAGKGHENYQILKNGKIDFDDSQVIRECLS